MALLKVGVFGTSKKINERRVPIHPDHLDWVEESLRPRLIFEKGYGERFGVSDEAIAQKTGGVASREELFANCDLYLLPKPVQADFEAMQENSILWGWPHCVQQPSYTQTAIDRRLTLIAWEAMHRWGEHGDWQLHIFNKNNEIAGYAGVLHAMGLAGIDGNYGPPRKAVVFSFGSVSRGAIHALRGIGFRDIIVFTQRYATLVGGQISGVQYRHFEKGPDGDLVALHQDLQNTTPLIEVLAEADIIVNGILQDTDNPLMFVKEGQTGDLKRGALIIDISCDEGMGFPFAQPTDFKNPMFRVEDVHYYAVDHTPSYLWNSASWEISRSLLPYLPIVMKGEKSWERNQTIRRAIEIKDGVIRNPKILSFQNRAATYPHALRTTS